MQKATCRLPVLCCAVYELHIHEELNTWLHETSLRCRVCHITAALIVFLGPVNKRCCNWQLLQFPRSSLANNLARLSLPLSLSLSPLSLLSLCTGRGVSTSDVVVSAATFSFSVEKVNEMETSSLFLGKKILRNDIF